MTPINAPTDWIRKLVQSGKIKEVHHRLTADQLIPVGCTLPLCLEDGTPCDAAYIRSLREDTPADEEAVTIDGAWETKVVDRKFSAYRDALYPGGHLFEDIAEELDLGVGIDHGSGLNFSATSCLFGVSQTNGIVYVLDECVSNGRTSEEDDARGLLAMLARWGIEWTQLKWVVGDRKLTGKDGLEKKSNKLLTKELCKLLKVKRLPRAIRTAKQGKGHGSGSVAFGVGWLHRALVRDRIFVHHECTRLRECLSRWKGADDDYKHMIDCLRYALDHLIFEKGQGPAGHVATYRQPYQQPL
jgi:hypothetical protein